MFQEFENNEGGCCCCTVGDNRCHLRGRLDQDIEKRRLSMCRAVDEVAVMAAVGDGKQEVVSHGVVGAVALILDVAHVDVGLREGP